MMKNKLFLFLFLLASPVYGEDIATIYFVWGSSLTQPQRNAIKNYGKNDHRIAANRTWLYETVCSGITNYVFIVTTQTSTENNFIVNAISQGRVERIGESKFVEEFDPIRGGIFSRLQYVYKAKLPKEYEDPNCH